MDYSKEYISMCKKATEIQELNEGDIKGVVVFYSHNDILGEVVGYRQSGDKDGTSFVEVGVIFDGNDSDAKILWYEEDMIGFTWLPRQDQLQKMYEIQIPNYVNKVELLLSIFNEEVHPTTNKEKYRQYQRFTSFEQLWLAFVMKKNYNKIWNSEKEEWNEIS